MSESEVIEKFIEHIMEVEQPHPVFGASQYVLSPEKLVLIIKFGIKLDVLIQV